MYFHFDPGGKYSKEYKYRNEALSSFSHFYSLFPRFLEILAPPRPIIPYFAAYIVYTIPTPRLILQAALSRSAEVPLVSMFNHNSCFDDPGLMGGILTTSQLADHRGILSHYSLSIVLSLFPPFFILSLLSLFSLFSFLTLS